MCFGEKGVEQYIGKARNANQREKSKALCFEMFPATSNAGVFWRFLTTCSSSLSDTCEF